MDFTSIDFNNLSDQKTSDCIKTYQTSFDKSDQVAPYVYHLFEKGCPRNGSKIILDHCTYSFDTEHIDVPTIIEQVLNDIYNGRAYTSIKQSIGVTQSEKLKLQAIKDHDLRLIMLSLLIYSKQYNHESGWINFGRKKIFAQAGMATIPERKKNLLLQQATEQKLLNMRVIGSKSPLLCYNLPWRSPVPVDVTAEDTVVAQFEVGPIARPKDFTQKAYEMFVLVSSENNTK